MSGTRGAVPRQRIVVVGMGNVYRRDDGAGPAVAARVAALVGGVSDRGPLADPFDLLGLWAGTDLAVVVDAVRSGAEVGTVRLIDLDTDPVPVPARALAGTTSTHGIGVADILRLARAVGNAPKRVVVVGIEGNDFGQGTGLSPAVRHAVPHAAQQVADLIGEAG